MTEASSEVWQGNQHFYTYEQDLMQPQGEMIMARGYLSDDQYLREY